MDKIKILERYKNEEDKLLISKLFDKIQMTEKQNKVQTTDFLSPTELQIVKNVLNLIQCKNYIIYGVVDNAQRNAIVFYPEKLETVFQENKFDFNSLFNCIRVINNNEKYDHKIYLGGLMKLGVKKEKIGDIIVYDNGADIIINKDITKFLMSSLNELTRFSKSKLTIIDLKEVIQKEQEYKDLKIIVSSLRLDNIVSELSKTSRSKSIEILKQERVFINYKNEIKATKSISEKDVITIRGIGKFIIDEISGNTRSGRYIIQVKKFV